MRGLKRIIVILMVSAIPALAQVDTLQLVEIGSIEAPGEITNLYVEDLDGDSLKEIILTTATNVHIYNGITYEEIWTSPELDHPRDLLFADINNDGFMDFSEKDTTNIRLFDPHNDAVIWTSPALDTTFVCYTVGSKDDDSWKDIGIVYLIETDTTVAFDTARTVLYSGPDFTVIDELSIPMVRFDSTYYSARWGRAEIPRQIRFYEITAQGQNSPYIVFISIYAGYYYEPTVGGSSLNGRVYLIDPIELNFDMFYTVGMIKHDALRFEGDSSYVFLLDYSAFMGVNYSTSSSRINHLTADTLRSYLLWDRDQPSGPDACYGYAIGNIDTSDISDEIGYGIISYYQNTVEICLKSMNALELLWIREFDVDCGPYVMAMVRSDNLDFLPGILGRNDYCFDGYVFMEGSTGDIRGYLPSDAPISKVADIDFDGNDELFSIQGTSLCICRLDYITGASKNIHLADRALLLSNYPNPFNSSTTIEYSLREAGHVTIEIYDLLGRRVETLVDEEQEAGQHRVIWDAGEHTSGVYFHRIVAGEVSETKRMVLLK